MTAVLELRDIMAGYNGRTVLKGVSLYVEKGEVAAIIGPNGAGKSTVIKTVMGIVKATKGEVYFKGAPLKNCLPFENIRRGISYVPQGNTVFGDLTVLENLHMGGYVLTDKTILTARIEEVFGLFPEILKRKDSDAGDLSGGEKQMLALGRAMMLRPEVLLLDEPSLGLSPKACRKAFDTIREIVTRFNMACIIVEQNVKGVLTIADRVYAMRLGEVVFNERPDALSFEMIRQAFLAS